MALIALIVDDDPYIRGYVRFILKRENFETIETDGGNRALQVVEAFGGAIDLIVTDIQMPNGDGVTFAKAVRQQYPSVPIILMSGHARPDVEFAFLEKPFSWAALVAEARKLIASSAGAVSDVYWKSGYTLSTGKR
jgi:two-component system, cell cycle sensor histidine kinase and response regulator CckA